MSEAEKPAKMSSDSAALKMQKMQDKMRGSVFQSQKGPGGNPLDGKLSELADVIRTYRGVDVETEDTTSEEVPWYDGPSFDIFMCSIILLNVFVIALETDLGDGEGYSRDAVWIFLEWFFCLLFMAEIYIKVQYKSWSWFREDPWSWLALFVAIFAFVNVTILSALKITGLRILQMVRVIQLIRLKRVLETNPWLKELKLVLRGMIGSYVSLIWALAVLTLIMFVFSVWTTTLIGFTEDYEDLEKNSNGWDSQSLFGSIFRSMFTLTQVMTLDTWCSNIVRYVETKKWYLCFVFFAFVMLTTYGIMNVIVAIIVEHTLTATNRSNKKVKEREERAKVAEMNNIREIFLLSDVESLQVLSLETFKKACKQDPEVQWRLRQLDLLYDDCERLFQVMDGNGSRSLSMNEFVDGFTKIKGDAKSKDLLALQHQADACANQMDLLHKELLDSELMLKQLDIITNRMSARFGPTLIHSRRMITERVRGAAPSVPIEEGRGHVLEGHLGATNMPRLPNLPNLVN